MHRETGYRLDATDLEIVRNLWDGRTPYSEIAERIGVTTNTVRSRVNRMREEGVLQIIALINPQAVEHHQSAFIGFKLEPSKSEQGIEQLGKLKGVVAASAVSGRFDVMAVVMFNEQHSYRRFLTEELNKVDGLVSSETFFVVAGDTFQLRYVL